MWCVETGKEGMISWTRSRRPGVKQQIVFSQHRVGDSSTDFHVPHTHQSAMSFTVNKTSISLTIDESENKLLSGHLTVCVVYVRKFICLHVFLFVYVWMWHIPKRIQIGTLRPIRVDHTNCLQVAIKTHSFIHKFLGRDQVTFLSTRPWSKMVCPMTQNRVHVTCTHIFWRVHTRKSARSTVPSDFLGSSHDHCNSSFTHAETQANLGLCATWKSVL
jgi:hypothetical protein